MTPYVTWLKEVKKAHADIRQEKIMLFGQSAGAINAYIISTLPEAPSLINSAISESLVLPSLVDRSSVQKAAASYAKVLKCDVGDVSTISAVS